MKLQRTDVTKGTQGSRRLVVLVHGWWASLPYFSIVDARDAIREILPDADLLEPRYRSHIASNTDPIAVAEELTDVIEFACEERRIASDAQEYQEIILIGYSLGSLIVRKTFVLGAMSRTADDAASTVDRKYKWPHKVSRIILLAGINNGWSLSPKPKRFSLLLYVMYRLLYPLAFILPIGRLIRSFHKGSRFVENLRIQWHHLEKHHELPPVIQLTGTEEDVVTEEDMVDMRFCSNFIFLHVPRTGHMNAANFRQKRIGQFRRNRFVTALAKPIVELRQEQDIEPQRLLDDATDATITDVIFLIHGIRDYGDWTQKVGEAIDHIAKAIERRVVVYRPAYERFPLLGFLLTMERIRKVRWFIDQYTQAIAKFPQARIHFIGHSNGTYLLAKSLELYPDCQFHNVIFTGSVVRRSFPWDRVIGQRRVARLRNDMAVDDLVVAIFPRFFEQFREVTRVPLSDIGSGGVYGFQDNSGKKYEVRLRGSHGAALAAENHDSLARWVLDIDELPFQASGVVRVQAVPAKTQWASAFCWVVWLALIMMPLTLVAMLSFSWFCLCPGFLAVVDNSFLDWVRHLQAPYAPIMLPATGTALCFWWLLKTI